MNDKKLQVLPHFLLHESDQEKWRLSVEAQSGSKFFSWFLLTALNVGIKKTRQLEANYFKLF